MENLKQRAIQAAERFLHHRGYDIVDVGWKSPAGGIDIVARDDDALVFVLASIYFSPFSPTYFYHSSQCDFADRANALSPLLASCRQPPCRRLPARCP